MSTWADIARRDHANHVFKNFYYIYGWWYLNVRSYCLVLECLEVMLLSLFLEISRHGCRFGHRRWPTGRLRSRLHVNIHMYGLFVLCMFCLLTSSTVSNPRTLMVKLQHVSMLGSFLARQTTVAHKIKSAVRVQASDTIRAYHASTFQYRKTVGM